MYLNGTTFFDNSTLSPDMVFGMRSVIPEDEYKAELTKKHFGKMTPTDFFGYNSSGFPFWSSEAFTYASSMLALSQYRALVTSGQLPGNFTPA
jgi:hypothetical protein